MYTYKHLKLNKNLKCKVMFVQIPEVSYDGVSQAKVLMENLTIPKRICV